jgi:outer membrane protein assembly factor BamB
MRRTQYLMIVLAAASGLFMGADWWQFRGRDGTSFVAKANIPVQFSDAKGIAWKIDLPGKGPSSPIVVGDKVFVTCSGGANQDQLYVVAVDGNSGGIAWQQRFWATGNCRCHPLSANAAPTPASDGKFIYAFFSSNDLACLDLDGNLVWFRGLSYDFPKARNDVGMSSSPIVANGVVVIQVESQGKSFCAALDAATGKTRWQVDRPAEASWSSPLLIPGSNQRPDLILLQSKGKTSLLSLTDGATVAEAAGECGLIPSSSVEGDRVYAPLDGTTAFDIDPSGQMKKAWNSPRLRSGTASLVVSPSEIFAVERNGVLNAFDRQNGERKWQSRLADGAEIQGGFWTTPVMIGEHFYFFAQNGQARVAKIGAAGAEIVHTFDFGETILGSPAISGDAMYVRGDQHLWKIAHTP